MAELKAFDTNILIYAFDIDEKAKHIKAKELFDSVCKGEIKGLLSIQNLTELFYWFVKSKRVNIELAESIINDFIEAKQWIVKDLMLHETALALNRKRIDRRPSCSAFLLRILSKIVLPIPFSRSDFH